MASHYIADGFVDDCDELVQRCVKEGRLTFETFTHIWQAMNMSSLYEGRNSGYEIAELSEEVILTAKHYMINITENFEKSIAGLFLVYALLNLQPYSDFASLRITYEDIPALQRLETVARREKRFDVLYILGSVLIKGPVQYHAEVRERGMEQAIRKYLDGYVSKERLGSRPKGVFYRQNEEMGLIQELNSISNRYSDAKSSLSVGVLDRNLCYANADLAKELEGSLKNVMAGINESGTEDDDSALSDDGDRAKNIKQKAMKTKVVGMRHLFGVNDKPVSSTEQSPEKTTSPRKRKSGRYGNRRCLKLDFIGSDYDGNLTETDVDSDNERETKEQEIEIQIDSLPNVIISEDGGKRYEIEIIDHQKSLGMIEDDTNDEQIKKVTHTTAISKNVSNKKKNEDNLKLEIETMINSPSTSTASKSKDTKDAKTNEGSEKKDRKQIVYGNLTENVNELEICNSGNTEKEANVSDNDEISNVLKSTQNKIKGKQGKSKDKSNSEVSSQNKDTIDNATSGSKRPGACLVTKQKRAKK